MLWKTVEIGLQAGGFLKGEHVFQSVFMRVWRGIQVGKALLVRADLREIWSWAITIKQA